MRPPGAPDWERTAVAWLFDLVPPDYRAHEVLRRYPVLLARFAGDHVAAGLEAARKGWRTVRVELADQLPADAIEAAMVAYEREGARLAAAARGRRGRGRGAARRALGAPALTPPRHAERCGTRRDSVATRSATCPAERHGSLRSPHRPGRGGRGGGEDGEAWSELDLS